MLRCRRTGKSWNDSSARHDEAAFEAILLRHGLMVRTVCRQLLDHHDVDDAFQAVFLVLVRKARSLRVEEVSGAVAVSGRAAAGGRSGTACFSGARA